MSAELPVKCPHEDCQWCGTLPSSPGDDFLRGDSRNVTIVTFRCPRCLRVWSARQIGDDVEILPLEQEDDPPFVWPPIDLGVGD